MKIYAEENNGSLRLSFSGELDHHGAKGVMKTVENLLDEYLPRVCVIDLSELSFMDSSGIAVILRINKRMNGMGGKAWVENPSGQALRVIDASGIDRVIRVIVQTR
ncbi:MAG: STAS domain-containing protein [Oscillospiraceae bacterium]|jgi:stage II sporulation protein AA (anti-sigma F factor antagonist)|nr:STAS domain-containing protein [Oscillospiraceae bacterium]